MQLTKRSILFSLTCLLLAIFGLASQQPVSALVLVLGTVAYFGLLRSNSSQRTESAR